MDLTALVGLMIRVSICLIVLGLGLGSTHRDVLYLFRRPGLLVRSLVSMSVIMPLVAAALAAAFGAHPAMQIALVALGVSPVPPLLPKREAIAGGRAAYAVSLLVTAALLAIVVVPVSMRLLGHLFGVQADMPMHIVARLVAIVILGPIVTGIVIRELAPALAARIARPIARVAIVLLAVGVALVLFKIGSTVIDLIGSGRVLAFAAFVIIGLLVGHLLGGPEPDHRAVLALSTASRHPGMALTIAGTLFPEHKLVTGALALYLLVSIILSIPYLIWMRRRVAGVGSAARP